MKQVFKIDQGFEPAAGPIRLILAGCGPLESGFLADFSSATPPLAEVELNLAQFPVVKDYQMPADAEMPAD